MSVNKVILVGNLGADPEVRYTAQGTPVANFRMATNENYTNKQGQKHERTEWHRIVCWGRLAEITGEYLSKGRQIYVEGRLQTRQWEDREGVKRYTTEITASNVRFLGGRNQANKAEQNTNEVPSAELEPSVSESAQQVFNSEDAPF